MRNIFVCWKIILVIFKKSQMLIKVETIMQKNKKKKKTLHHFIAECTITIIDSIIDILDMFFE